MRRVITTVVVLLALLVLADRLGVLYAEHRVAVTLRNTENLGTSPTVKIHGFPFLTQLLRERFSDVEVIVKGFTRAGAVDYDRIDVHLHDARVALGDALAGGGTRVPVKRVDGTAVVGYSALNRAHQGLSFGYAGSNTIRVSGAVSISGRTVDATGTGRMVLEGNRLLVLVDSVTVANGATVGAADAAARGAFAVRTALATLPFHFTLKSVRATSAGIEVAGSADNVTLATG
jgi:hypothetical protein